MANRVCILVVVWHLADSRAAGEADRIPLVLGGGFVVERDNSRRRWLPVAGWLLAVLCAAVAGWWAASRVTQPPEISTPMASTTTVAVVEGSVEVAQEYGIDATWQASPLGVNGYSGTLTHLGVSPAGTRLDVGDVAYSVDLQPAVMAVGAIPAFRTLETGDEGADVKQLQRFLKSQGFDPGSVNGRYGSSTADAVDRWSAHLGLPMDGRVPLGRIVFVPSLPATIATVPGARLGLRVQPGDELLTGPSGEPRFTFRVLPEDVGRTVEGMQVSMRVGEDVWRAEVASLAADPDTGATIAVLRPVTGATSICGDDCADAVAVGNQAVLPGTLVIVPQTSGAQVPTTAIGADAKGVTFVTMASGERRPVTVKASSDGASIVSGVDAGERVVITSAGA